MLQYLRVLRTFVQLTAELLFWECTNLAESTMRDWLAGTLLLSALMLVGANGQQQQEKKDDFTKALDDALFELHRSVTILVN